MVKMWAAEPRVRNMEYTWGNLVRPEIKKYFPRGFSLEGNFVNADLGVVAMGENGRPLWEDEKVRAQPGRASIVQSAKLVSDIKAQQQQPKNASSFFWGSDLPAGRDSNKRNFLLNIDTPVRHKDSGMSTDDSKSESDSPYSGDKNNGVLVAEVEGDWGAVGEVGAFSSDEALSRLHAGDRYVCVRERECVCVCMCVCVCLCVCMRR